MSLNGPDSADPRSALAEQEEFDLAAHQEKILAEKRQRSLRREMVREGHSDLITQLVGSGEDRQYIDTLIEAALSGTLPRSRDLLPWEVAKLGAQHIQMIFMRATGMKPGLIARLMGVGGATVSKVLGHPDAQFLLARIISLATDDVIDTEKRLQNLAPEAVDTVLDVMRNGKPETALKAAFGILDRTGHGKEVKQKITHEVSVPLKHANLLVDALAEAEDIEEAVYVDITDGEPGREGVVSVQGSAGAPPAGNSQVPSTAVERVA